MSKDYVVRLHPLGPPAGSVRLARDLFPFSPRQPSFASRPRSYLIQRKPKFPCSSARTSGLLNQYPSGYPHACFTITTTKNRTCSYDCGNKVDQGKSNDSNSLIAPTDILTPLSCWNLRAIRVYLRTYICRRYSHGKLSHTPHLKDANDRRRSTKGKPVRNIHANRNSPPRRDQDMDVT
jgi:hypothetical protein